MTMDKTLTCRDCQESFTFTAGEQDFYQQKGFTNEPTRCPNCRQARKRSRDGGGYSGGGSYSAGGGAAGGAPKRERQMFTVVCAECGKDTEVPFNPRGDRPVYCSDCYRAQRA
jgi:CxxC-x17-CxxC domain-containing protein